MFWAVLKYVTGMIKICDWQVNICIGEAKTGNGQA